MARAATAETSRRRSLGALRSGRGALAALSMAILLSSLATSIANIALPGLAQAFAASFHEVQWVVLAYLLALTTLIVGVGRLGDLVGRRRLLIAGTILFTAASLACGIAPTLWLLVGARAAQGLGAAMMMALALALVGETVTKARTGAAMGLLGTMSAFGTALGPSLGGALIAAFGWRAIFLAILPLGLAALYLAWRHLPVDAVRPRADRRRFDLAGSALLAAALGAYALSMTAGRGAFGNLEIGLLAAAGLGFGLFALVQTRAAAPLIRLGMLRQPAVGMGLATNALVSTVMMSTLVVGPFYLTRALRLGEALVGAAMTVGPAISALTGMPAGRLVDRFGASAVMLSGLLAMAAGSLALAILPAAYGLPGYVVALAVLTPGYQLFQAANNTAVMGTIAAGERGVASALLNLSRNLGLVTGASLMGAVFAVATGDGEVTAAAPDAIAAGMSVTFTVAAGLVGAALALALAGRALASRAEAHAA